MEQLKRVPETNIKSAVSLFQTEVPNGLLRSGVEAGVFWHGGRQLRIPYGIRPALGLPAKQLEDTPRQLKDYVLQNGGRTMVYTAQYASPLGTITLACDETAIIGLWFNGQKYFGNILPAQREEKEHPLLRDARRWLDIYFSGRAPDLTPPLHYDSTPFRKQVCDIMLTIPYGKTMTYGEIAAEAARRQGRSRMSAQAVGGAVGHNPISLMIPCHRVVGSNGSLTGYAGGVGRKVKLLELEHADMTHLFVPKKGTAL